MLSTSRVAILGLGLMGGSLALALRGKCQLILGVDPDPQTLELALQQGIIDRGSIDPIKILPAADFIILAAPVRANLDYLHNLPLLHPGPALVFDLGGTKVEIVSAMDNLPASFTAIGGHPMCGKERGGLSNASADLFEGAPFVLVDTSRTSPSARNLVEELVAAVGGVPMWLDPQTHDSWIAVTSQLPYLVSNSLAYTTPADSKPLVGPGFRSTVRLAVSTPAMRLDTLSTNRQQVLAALRRFRQHLERVENCLEDEDDARLKDFLEQGATRQRDLLSTNQLES
jgi:prephenate dehydrogenase